MISLPQTIPSSGAWYADLGHLVRVVAILAGLIVILLALILFAFGIAPASLFTIARDTFGHAVYGLISRLAVGHDDGNCKNTRSTR